MTQALAGFTLSQADVLCFAIRKKIREKLDAQKMKFVEGCLRNGVHADVIEQVWKDFEPFARYGFNRAHAAIYGVIAYHTAYLKANYTLEYMTAVLSSDMGNSERIAIAVAECRRMGIAVLPPDVNESEFGFAITPKGIRFGLGAVKNVGAGAVESIIEARRAGGRYRSLNDFCGRIDLQRCNKRVLESLIKCGALDAFGPRAVQLAHLDLALGTAQREQRDRESGQVGLFASLGLTDEIEAQPLPAGSEAPKRELLGWEKELLGIYLSEHPLQRMAERMGDVVTAYLAELKEAGEELVTVACVVTSARKHITKEKKLMMFAQVEDLTGTTEVTVFPRTYEATAALWNTDEILLVLARVEQRDEAPKLLCEHAVRFDDAGIAEIRRVADERRQSLAKRAKFMRPANGNGHDRGGSGAAGGAARLAGGHLNGNVVAGSTVRVGDDTRRVTRRPAVEPTIPFGLGARDPIPRSSGLRTVDRDLPADPAGPQVARGARGGDLGIAARCRRRATCPDVVPRASVAPARRGRRQRGRRRRGRGRPAALALVTKRATICVRTDTFARDDAPPSRAAPRSHQRDAQHPRSGQALRDRGSRRAVARQRRRGVAHGR